MTNLRNHPIKYNTKICNQVYIRALFIMEISFVWNPVYYGTLFITGHSLLCNPVYYGIMFIAEHCSLWNPCLLRNYYYCGSSDSLTVFYISLNVKSKLEYYVPVGRFAEFVYNLCYSEELLTLTAQVCYGTVCSAVVSMFVTYVG
jgi:hypothetical protein